MSALDLIKAHPWLTGAGVITVIAGTWILTSPGTDTSGAIATTGGTSDAQIAAGLQIQGASLAAQSHSEEIQAARDVAIAHDAAALAVATLQSHTQDNANVLAANIAYETTAASERVTTLTTTLQAHNDAARIEADAAETASQYATIQAQTQAQVNLAAQYAQSQAQLVAANNAAQVQLAEIAARPKGLFSWLFG